MFILIWIIIIIFLLGFVAISEYNIAKQDEEWMKDFKKEKNQWKKK